MTKLTSLLVGAYHSPPASKVLLHLPQGAELSLRPEPDNPYDELAIQVLCAPQAAVPPSQRELLEQNLEGTGWSLEDLLDLSELQLGYVAKSGGKPIAKAQGTCVEKLTGNAEWHEAGATSGQARLVFSPEGNAMVEVELSDA